MYSQSFSKEELYECIHQRERRNLNLTKKKFGKLYENEMGDFTTTGNFSFEFIKKQEIYLNDQTSVNKKFFQNLIIRKLSQNIRQIYYIKQSDRNLIIKQIISLLKESRECFVIRLDVKSFYESVNERDILNKFEYNGRLSALSVKLLNKIFNLPLIKLNGGLPRGLSISALMSEYYMKYFDLEIKELPDVYYYARFVDDIIIFCESETSMETVWNKAKDSLGKLGLSLNLSKSAKWKTTDNMPMTFLGYSFCNNNGNLSIRIAQKKINKIKTKIIRAFYRYKYDNNDNMLEKRIKYLTGNFNVKSKALTKIYAGIYYNYKLISDKDQLKELDIFLGHILYSHNFVRLSSTLIANLKKYRFEKGFDNKIRHHFTTMDIEQIKSCWLCV